MEIDLENFGVVLFDPKDNGGRQFDPNTANNVRVRVQMKLAVPESGIVHPCLFGYVESIHASCDFSLTVKTWGGQWGISEAFVKKSVDGKLWVAGEELPNWYGGCLNFSRFPNERITLDFGQGKKEVDLTLVQRNIVRSGGLEWSV